MPVPAFCIGLSLTCTMSDDRRRARAPAPRAPYTYTAAGRTPLLAHGPGSHSYDRHGARVAVTATAASTVTHSDGSGDRTSSMQSRDMGHPAFEHPRAHSHSPFSTSDAHINTKHTHLCPLLHSYELSPGHQVAPGTWGRGRFLFVFNRWAAQGQRPVVRPCWWAWAGRGAGRAGRGCWGERPRLVFPWQLAPQRPRPRHTAISAHSPFPYLRRTASPPPPPPI
jgi:hypothetical protein